jgi:hypothetical protein
VKTADKYSSSIWELGQPDTPVTKVVLLIRYPLPMEKTDLWLSNSIQSLFAINGNVHAFYTKNPTDTMPYCFSGFLPSFRNRL